MTIKTYPSNLVPRILATLIDYGFYFLIFYCYLIYFGDETSEGYSVHGVMALPLNILWVLYFVVIESANSATIGHTLLNLKVETTKGRKIDFIDSFKRRLLDPIDIFFWGIPAIIAIKNSDKSQRLGDMWAGTVVVKTENTKS